MRGNLGVTSGSHQGGRVERRRKKEVCGRDGFRCRKLGGYSGRWENKGGDCEPGWAVGRNSRNVLLSLLAEMEEESTV